MLVIAVGPSLVGTLLAGDAVGASVGDPLVDASVGTNVGAKVGDIVVARNEGGLLLGARVVATSVALPEMFSDVRLVRVAVVVFGGSPISVAVPLLSATGAGDAVVLLIGNGGGSTSRGTVTHSPGTPTQYTGTKTGHCREALCSCTTASVGHSKASIGGTSTGQAGGLRLRGSYVSIVMPVLPPDGTAL